MSQFGFDKAKDRWCEDGERSQRKVKWENQWRLEEVAAVGPCDVLQVAPKLKQRPPSRPEQRTAEPSQIFLLSTERLAMRVGVENFACNRPRASRKKPVNHNFLNDVAGNKRR